MKQLDLRVYAITDRHWLKEGEELSEAVEGAILGGATFVQFREKLLKGEALEEEARKVQKVCRKYEIPFIINDDVELAKKLDADGVHVGQSDMELTQARKILGPEKIIGVTAKTVPQALEAEKNGADYLGSGAVFGSTTKTDAKPMSFSLFQEITQSVSIPVVAIGGIDETNVSSLKGLGMSGIAVVSAIFAKEDKQEAARQLRELLENV